MNFYSKITKTVANEDGSLTVYGVASSDAQDTDGDIITSEAMMKALPDFFKKGGQLKEMHKAHTDAGTVSESAHACDESCKTYITATVKDKDAIAKVNANVYTGFSIGGSIIKRNEENSAIVEEIELDEISLVTKPANQEAKILLAKSEKEDLMDEENNDVVLEAELKKEADALRKGMYGVSYLAQIIDDLTYLQSNTEWESMVEGDNSPIPEELKAQIKALGATLVSMVNEELSELSEGEEMAKAGKAISNGNKKKLEDMHTHAEAITKMCKEMHGGIDDDESEPKDDKKEEEGGKEEVKKSEKEPQALITNEALEKMEKMSNQLEALEKELKELKAQPSNKATLRVVEKSGDELQKSEKELSQLELIEQARRSAMGY